MKRTILTSILFMFIAALFLIIPISKSEAVSYPNGTLIRAEGDPKVFVIHNNKKRWLRNEAIFNSYFLSWDAVKVLPPSIVDVTPYNNFIRADGIMVFALNDLGYKRHILNPTIFDSYGLNWGDIADINATELANYPDTNLIRQAGDEKVYYIEGNTKRWVETAEAFETNNFDWEAIQIINEVDMNTYILGKEITAAKDVLEEKVPEITNYPEFEQTVMDLYSSDEFTDSEIKFIKAVFDIFKLKTNLHQANEEALAYLVSNRSEPDLILSKNYAVDLDYFVEEVMPLANNITKGSSNDTESVRKIVLWVRENINRQSVDVREDRVEEMLEKRAAGSSVCDFFATLITALCRASGIPAREISAGLEDPGHALVEVYVDGKWIVVDSTGFYGLILGDEEINELGQWLHTAHVYNPLDDRLIDVSLSYNKVALNSIIEYAKEIIGDIEAIRRAEEILNQFNEEQDLAKKYAYAQEIIRICNREIIAKKEEYDPSQIKVIYLWDFDKESRDENFLDKLKNIKAISLYDITNADEDRYTCKGCVSEFPLEKFSEVISEIKPQFPGKIYSFLAHYKVAKWKELINIETDLVVRLLNPEDTDILRASYQDLPLGSYEILRDFVIEISAVISGTKDSTTFYLPKTLPAGVEYEIKAAGHSEKMFFLMLSKVSLQNIETALETEQIDIYPERLVNKTLIKAPIGSFDNLRVINEKGEIYADPRIYGGSGFSCDEIATMLWSISLWGGQTLKIWRENDVIIIQGTMKQPQSETIKKYSDLLM